MFAHACLQLGRRALQIERPQIQRTGLPQLPLDVVCIDVDPDPLRAQMFVNGALARTVGPGKDPHAGLGSTNGRAGVVYTLRHRLISVPPLALTPAFRPA
ncbi:hypothetical protein [Xanthomonas euvesicatoria]|uniref:hypothetical protein n=1 Tax=Xanthomonas euvesicatoria TaxID=456327 RepID=UPI002E12A556